MNDSRMLPEGAVPTARARELVRVGYDLHVHVAPDVMIRRITDIELAHACLAVGLVGFALKPHYVSTAERAPDQCRLVEMGAYLERCLTTPLTGKYPWEEMVGNIRAVGVEHNLGTTDLGQPHDPPVENGLALMADAMLAAGFSDDEIHLMIVENSRAMAVTCNGAASV